MRASPGEENKEGERLRGREELPGEEEERAALEMEEEEEDHFTAPSSSSSSFSLTFL